ncbi:C39 family peptidase [bacterium]|nr:C39 family peptidase [bacterium]MCI0603888.1 C39 family peptidase [bacterium]
MNWSIFPVLALFLSLIWIDVPFIRQEEKGCGAASIAMVMQYWQSEGHHVPEEASSPSRIMQLLYSKPEEGIRAEDLTRYLEEHGFQTFSFSGKSEDLAHHIKKGRPLIVSLEAEGKTGKLHFLVVAGVDPENELVLVNDPAERKLLKMKRTTFEKRWAATKNWTLLALPEQ